MFSQSYTGGLTFISVHTLVFFLFCQELCCLVKTSPTAKGLFCGVLKCKSESWSGPSQCEQGTQVWGQVRTPREYIHVSLWRTKKRIDKHMTIEKHEIVNLHNKGHKHNAPLRLLKHTDNFPIVAFLHSWAWEVRAKQESSESVATRALHLWVLKVLSLYRKFLCRTIAQLALESVLPQTNNIVYLRLTRTLPDYQHTTQYWQTWTTWARFLSHCSF